MRCFLTYIQLSLIEGDSWGLNLYGRYRRQQNRCFSAATRGIVHSSETVAPALFAMAPVGIRWRPAVPSPWATGQGRDIRPQVRVAAVMALSPG
jgi:hypothetical protein